MTSLWKKGVPSTTIIEDSARELMKKHDITSELGRAVREIQLNYISKSSEISGGEEADSLCSCLEAAFLHGGKNSLARKMSSVFAFGSDKMPEPDFWPVVMVYSHKQVLTQINHLNFISTDIGRCRAWLRLTLNEGLLQSYIEALILDQNALNSFYRSLAFLRDSEQLDIMKNYLEGLSVFKFQMPVNSSILNSWTPEPLQLAGIWSPPLSPDPIMPAVDVVSMLDDPTQYKPKKSKKVHSSSPRHYHNSDPISCTPTSQASADDSIISEDLLSIEKSGEQTEGQESGQYSSEPGYRSSSFQSIINGSSSPHSLPGFEHMFVEDNDLPKVEEDIPGNKLMRGWSSSFESEDVANQTKAGDSVSDSQSYDSLLQSYTKNQTKFQLLAHTPELEFFPFPEDVPSEPKVDSPTSPADSNIDLLEFEILPKTCAFTSKNADETTATLINLFDKICPEKGLNDQNYKCQGCNAPIGMIYGNPYISCYDGLNYCSECHANEEFYIPSRILYNWDFRKHPVAKQHKEFLLKVQEEPMFDIRKQNPQLYTVVQELVELQLMRTQLSFLRSYLFTCREQVAEQLRKLIWPREYLYEHIHVYSLTDMLQVPNRVLAQTLQKAISFASKHVLKCPLCSQKGFICEVCDSSKIIYPFETETTFHCDECLAVYHSACMNGSKPCPKCNRIKKRKEHKDLWVSAEQESEHGSPAAV